MLGASLLSLGYLFHKLGWIMGSVLFLLSIIISLFTYYQIASMASIYPSTSYREVTKNVNPKLSLALDLTLLVKYIGVFTTYLIIASNSIIDFFSVVAKVDFNPYAVKAITAIVLTFPLTFIKSMEKLSKVGMVACLIVLVTIVTIIVYYVKYHENGIPQLGQPYNLAAFPNTDDGLTIFLWFLMYIPSLQGNYSIQTAIPTLLYELKAKNKKKLVLQSSFIASMMATFIYFLVGLLMSSMFGDKVSDNMFSDFSILNNVYLQVLSLLYGIVCIFVLIIILYPLVQSLLKLSKANEKSKKVYTTAKIGFNLLYIVVSMLFSMFLKSILAVFSFFNALAGILQYFVVPIYFAIILPREQYKEQQRVKDREETNEEQDDQPDDNLAVPLISLFTQGTSRNSIQQVRRMSLAIRRKFTKDEVRQRMHSLYTPNNRRSQSNRQSQQIQHHSHSIALGELPSGRERLDQRSPSTPGQPQQLEIQRILSELRQEENINQENVDQQNQQNTEQQNQENIDQQNTNQQNQENITQENQENQDNQQQENQQNTTQEESHPQLQHQSIDLALDQQIEMPQQQEQQNNEDKQQPNEHHSQVEQSRSLDINQITQNDNVEIKQEQKPFIENKKRTITYYCLMGLFIAISLEGAVMNAIALFK